MGYDNALTNASLRKADYAHFTAMRAGSDRLHIAILRAQGIVAAKAKRAKPVEIRWMPKQAEKPLTIAEIKTAVARFFNIHPDRLSGGSRKPLDVRARAVAMTALKRRGNSYSAMAPWFGLKDHTTVRHSVLKLASNMSEHEAELIERLVGKAVPDGDA